MEAVKKNRRIVIGILLLIIVALYCTGCSAQWHLKKARAKDPSIFEVKTITEIQTIATPLAELQFNCIELMKNGPIQLYSPILRIVNGKPTADSVGVQLTPVIDANGENNGAIAAMIDCPDSEVVTVTKTETIQLKPEVWHIIMYWAVGFIVGVLLMLKR